MKPTLPILTALLLAPPRGCMLSTTRTKPPSHKRPAGRRVALDDQGALADTWLKAAGIDSIPATVLIGRHGKIAIGQPTELSAERIESVLKEK